MSGNVGNPDGPADQVVVTLVRHGETAWNTQRQFQGWADVPLSALGRDQATALAARLDSSHYERVWSSDLGRAVETARLLGWEPTRDERLRELDFGSLEGAVWTDLDGSTQAELIDFDGFAAPGGESVVALRQRVKGYLDSLRPGHHLVVTHAGPIRVVLQACGLEAHPGPCETAEINWTTKEVINAESAAVSK